MIYMQNQLSPHIYSQIRPVWCFIYQQQKPQVGDCPPGKVHEWQIEAEHRHEHLLREAMAGFLDRPVIPQQKNLHQMSNQVQNDQKNSKATYEKKDQIMILNYPSLRLQTSHKFTVYHVSPKLGIGCT